MLRRSTAPFVLLAVAALALSGCFQFQTILRLSADGSGEIEEMILFNDLIMSVMAGDSTEVPLFTEEALVARADSFGTGVRFVRADSLMEDGFVGYRAVYAFDDVNTVRLVPSDGGELGGGADASAAGSPLSALSFDYTPGRLRIVVPREERPDAAPLDPDSVAAAAAEMKKQAGEAALLRGFLDGARLSVAVVLPGPVTETNARYASADTVTVTDLRLGAFFDLMSENPELAARLQLAETPEERAAALDEVNAYGGLQFESAEEIVVEFEE